MKRKATIISAALILCVTMGTLALAKNKLHTINFEQDVTVNGTLVKKGEYQARFNEQTGEFTILDGKRVVATATAKEEMLNKKAAGTAFDLKNGDGAVTLTKVTFGGERYALLIGDAQAADGQ